jgi:hypothetical protein
MKRLNSPTTNYTVDMLKRGDSIISWYTAMMSLAADAHFKTDDQKRHCIWFKFDAELRKDLPPLRSTETIQGTGPLKAVPRKTGELSLARKI